jgi:hypothetical protein
LKDEPFDEQLRQLNQAPQSISSLFPGHVWTALPDGYIEYLSPSLCEYTGIKEARDRDFFRAAIHPDDLQANDRYWDALRDNGSGITGGDSIFDAIVTTKSKGMGIGLAVSRSIIEAHQGRLTATNNEGYGATFSVVLPVLPVQTSQLEVGANDLSGAT